MSTEPILSPPPVAGSCAACGAVLAADQRYCLECGERRPAISEFLRTGPPGAPPPAAEPPLAPPAGVRVAERSDRANEWLTVLAGIGVLLLAMGVGVLIGRAGSSGRAAPAQVITVDSGGGTAAGGSSTSGEESFAGDWPAGTKGYTVQLQTLPEASAAAAVSLAKAAASAKGAASVGALKESDYASLKGSGFLIFAGVYEKRAEAEKELASLRSKFSGAKVVEVANGGSSGTGPGTAAEKAEAAGAERESKASLGKPAPPAALKNLGHAKGKNYEEKSRQLPNVVETG